MTTVDIRQLPSRRLQKTIPIPWAEPATPPAGVPFSAYGMAQQTPRRRRKGSTRFVFIDMNVYYEPPVLSDAPHVATELSGFHRHQGLNRKLLDVELNEYPTAAPMPFQYSSIVESGFNFNKGLGRKLLNVLELNEFTQAPPPVFHYASIVESGFYKNDGLNRQRRDVEQLDTFPPKPTIPGLLPTYYTVESFYRPRVRYRAQQAPFAFPVAASSFGPAYITFVVKPKVHSFKVTAKNTRFN